MASTELVIDSDLVTSVVSGLLLFSLSSYVTFRFSLRIMSVFSFFIVTFAIHIAAESISIKYY